MLRARGGYALLIGRLGRRFIKRLTLLDVSHYDRVDSFNCKLDLSSTAHCGQRFGFWVTAVNLNHNRGVERIRSFANSVIDIKCDGLSLTKKVGFDGNIIS